MPDHPPDGNEQNNDWVSVHLGPLYFGNKSYNKSAEILQTRDFSVELNGEKMHRKMTYNTKLSDA